MRAILLGVLAVFAVAQDQTGDIEGVVLDALSHQPVKKATVTINGENTTGVQAQTLRGQSVITDASGAFDASGTAKGPSIELVAYYPASKHGAPIPTATLSRVSLIRK